MSMKIVPLMILASTAILMTGCATPEYRIKQNQALFDSFSPEEQAEIRLGKVKVGFNAEMAKIALGEPDRTYTRTTEQGVTKVWAYIQRITRTRREPVRGHFRYRDSNGKVHHGHGTDYVSVDTHIEYDRLRLEFAEGIITALEEVNQ